MFVYMVGLLNSKTAPPRSDKSSPLWENPKLAAQRGSTGNPSRMSPWTVDLNGFVWRIIAGKGFISDCWPFCLARFWGIRTNHGDTERSIPWDWFFIYVLEGGGFPGGWGGVGCGGVGCNNVHVTCVVGWDATLMCGVVGWDGLGCNNVHVTTQSSIFTKRLVVWNINFIFPYIGNNHPNWLIFFRGVQTTNQKKPGLESVVKALARFQLLAMKSCRTPMWVFKEAPWDAWKGKSSWLTALGNFVDVQKYREFPLKNNITSKYRGNTVNYNLFPMIFDIWLNVHLVIPMGGKNTKHKNMLSWSMYDFNFDGRKRNDP